VDDAAAAHGGEDRGLQVFSRGRLAADPSGVSAGGDERAVGGGDQFEAPGEPEPCGEVEKRRRIIKPVGDLRIAEVSRHLVR